MTRARSIAYHLCWLILIVGLLCFLAGVWWVFGAPPFDGFGVGGTPGAFLPIRLFDEDTWLTEIMVNGAVYLGVFLVLQWIFLRPRRGWQFKLTASGRPMRSAIVAAAFVAMLLTTGMILTLVEVFYGWEPAVEIPDLVACWIVMALLWALWAGVFFIYNRQGDRYIPCGKIVRGLIAGSFLELFVATGVYAWNPHKEDCYCGRGSYTGLVFGGTVLLWAFGPGIVLLFMREKDRRDRLLPSCRKCGYNLAGNESGVCPECGTEVQAT